MQEIIEPIIHKAAVHDLQTKIRHTGLCIGDPAELHLCDDGRVEVYTKINMRSFLLRRRKLAHIGDLGAKASQILTPALRRGDYLRVRVVGLTPEHLAHDGKAEMHISVWGTVRYIHAPKPTQPPAPLARKTDVNIQ